MSHISVGRRVGAKLRSWTGGRGGMLRYHYVGFIPLADTDSRSSRFDRTDEGKPGDGQTDQKGRLNGMMGSCISLWCWFIPRPFPSPPPPTLPYKHAHTQFPHFIGHYTSPENIRTMAMTSYPTHVQYSAKASSHLHFFIIDAVL